MIQKYSHSQKLSKQERLTQLEERIYIDRYKSCRYLHWGIQFRITKKFIIRNLIITN